MYSASCTHTNEDANPWWAVDLGKEMKVVRLAITNRADCCPDRLKDFDVGLTNIDPSKTAPVASSYSLCAHYTGYFSNTANIDCSPDVVPGRYLVVRLPVKQYLTLCEVEVYISTP
jgi:hypothetical protein